MAEFWEQQLMDRLLSLCFEFKKSDEEVMPAQQMTDVIDYVKFLLKNKAKEAAEDAK